MIPWFIALIEIIAIITLWLCMVKSELTPLRDAVQGADKQAQLYRELLVGAEDTEKRAYMQERYNECCRIYASQASLYMRMLRKTHYVPAAWLLGFRSVPEAIDT